MLRRGAGVSVRPASEPAETTRHEARAARIAGPARWDRRGGGGNGPWSISAPRSHCVTGATPNAGQQRAARRILTLWLW